MRRLINIDIEQFAESLVPFASRIMADIPDHDTLPLPQQQAIKVGAAKLLLHCPTIRRNAQIWTHHRDAVLKVLSHWGIAEEICDGLFIHIGPFDADAFCQATDFGLYEQKYGRFNIIAAELDRLGSILTEIEAEISHAEIAESNAE